jgi:hypothetical protein
MKNLIALLLITVGIYGTSCMDEDQPTPIPLVSFKVSGKLVFSCQNPTPLRNFQVTVGNTKLYTDSLGNFNGTATAYGSITAASIHGKNENTYISLRNGIQAQDTELGTLFATSPPQVSCVVFYNLKNLKLSGFNPVTIQFSKIGPNKDKVANTPNDLFKPDTIIISSDNFRLVPPNTSSIFGSYISTKIGNDKSYDHFLNFSDLCGQKVTTIEFPG